MYKATHQTHLTDCKTDPTTTKKKTTPDTERKGFWECLWGMLYTNGFDQLWPESVGAFI